MLITNNFSSFYLNLLVEPLAITTAFRSTLAGAALGAGIETPKAVFIKAVTQVYPTIKQKALAVIYLALCCY